MLAMLKGREQIGGSQGPLRVGLGLALCLVACRATPEPIPPLGPLSLPDDFSVSASHYVGTALGGPRPDRGVADIATDPERLLDLETAVLYLREGPDQLRLAAPDALQPLVGEFELALSLGGQPGLSPAPRLFEGGLIATGEPARDLFRALSAHGDVWSLDLERRAELLGPGMAFEVTGRTAEFVPDADNFLGEFAMRPPIPMGFRLAISAKADPDSTGLLMRWCLSLSGAAPRQPGSIVLPGEERYRPGSPAPVEELIRPTARPQAGEPILVLVRAPFESGATHSLAFWLDVSADPDADATDRQVAIDRALASIEARQQSVQPRVETGSLTERAVPEALGRLKVSMQAGEDLRPTLLFLAGTLDAPLAKDVLLALQPSELNALTAWLLDDQNAKTRAPRWSLETHAWRALIAAVRGSRLAPPTLADPSATTVATPTTTPTEAPRTRGERATLEGLILRHAGEAGRFPRLLEGLLTISVDTADYNLRLVAENRLFLEDSSPAARVRSYDWLKARGYAPANFDPLGTKGARRAALEAKPTANL